MDQHELDQIAALWIQLDETDPGRAGLLAERYADVITFIGNEVLISNAGEDIDEIVDLEIELEKALG